MGSLIDGFVVLSIFVVIGLPLTIFLGAVAGVLWAWFDHLPGWYFIGAFGLLLAIGVRTVIWGRQFTPEGEDLEAMIPTLLLPLNLMIALPVLVVALIAWFWRRRNRQNELRRAAPVS